MKVLVTCPPMLGLIDEFRAVFEAANVELLAPPVVQTLSEDELVGILPEQDGWIAGDDPATRRVLSAGAAGRLRALVMRGHRHRQRHFRCCSGPQTRQQYTGNAWPRVADVAMAYVIGLARDLFS